MITNSPDTNEVLAAIDEAVTELVNLMSLLNENQVNAIPYEDSWTAAQLLIHITKSTGGMAKAVQMESKPALRDPGEKIPHLKNAFLNFSNKMKSPDFIVPEEGVYEKQIVIDELNNSFQQFKENIIKENLTDLVEGLPFGEVTKLELLHFVLYHTQRHLHQMKKIFDALKMKE